MFRWLVDNLCIKWLKSKHMVHYIKYNNSYHSVDYPWIKHMILQYETSVSLYDLHDAAWFFFYIM